MLFFMDCESGSGASLDAQDASGGSGLLALHGVGGFGTVPGGPWLHWHGCLTRSVLRDMPECWCASLSFAQTAEAAGFRGV